MGFEAKIICDSVSPEGKRITTFQLCYPRFIHSELMTHRVFSRNAMSSRAVPVAKMIEQVRNDPAMPVHWGKNQPGMQAREELSPANRKEVEALWRLAADSAANHASLMVEYGAHKQIVNRLLEPWQWMHTIVTATEWDNFFALRCHPDAQPEFHHLALMMRAEMERWRPIDLLNGQWHLPYVTVGYVTEKVSNDRQYFVSGPRRLTLKEAIKCSIARCARVSFLTHEGKEPVVEDDLKLYDRLMGSEPRHASPSEHQATPDIKRQTSMHRADWESPRMRGNFVGWCQARKFIEDAPNYLN